MTQTIEAIYDGTVLRPAEVLELEPNTRVRLVVEALPDAPAPASFLRVARGLKLEGPADWSVNPDGEATHGAGDSVRG